jgi:hypothetical protein
MRVPQNQKDKGSQNWLQLLINQKPDMLNALLRERIPKLSANSIEWLSPLKDDAYAEYSDQAFLDILGIKHLKIPLSNFWPRGGPQWDGLGKNRCQNRCRILIRVEKESNLD